MENHFSQFWRLESACRVTFCVADCRFFLVSSHDELREDKSSLMILIQGLNPLTRAPPLWPHLILITSQGPCLLMMSHWGVGFQHLNFSGGVHKDTFLSVFIILTYLHRQCCKTKICSLWLFFFVYSTYGSDYIWTP